MDQRSSLPYGLVDVRSRETGQRVMQLSDKFTPVVLWHTHERPTHYNKLNLETLHKTLEENTHVVMLAYLVNIMAQALQLLNSPSRLFIWIVPCTDSPHARWFVAGIALCTVVEI